MSYAWIITKDVLENKSSNIVGPRSCKLTAKEITEHQDGVAFRMYDDDDILYYEGILVGGAGLEPLDDFGEPNAGCTRIDVLGKNGWETV